MAVPYRSISAMGRRFNTLISNTVTAVRTREAESNRASSYKTACRLTKGSSDLKSEISFRSPKNFFLVPTA